MVQDFNCTIPSDIKYIGPAVENILSYLNDMAGKISTDSIFDIKVILNELILNSIKHGNRNNISKQVKVRVEVDSDSNITFIVEDEGEGFDHCNVQILPSLNESDEPCYLNETGRGILICRNLCSSISYNEKGNVVTAVKILKKPGP
ncbi:MAG: ATP-binding protein [Bacillota bacterium]|nr:ATP-binding protein [Bacillota bacterium]